MFEAFQLGPFLIWTNLLFLMIGLWLSAEFFFRLAQSANLSLTHFVEQGVWYIIAFFFGGRIVAVGAEYRVYLKDILRILIFWDGNFNILGGAIGMGVVLYIFNLKQRSTFLQWLDALVPATSLALVFSWLGAFFSGSAYGRPTDMIWGITYDAQNVRYAVPVHPVQLYYALYFFFLTFLLLVIRKKARRVGTETLAGIFFMTLGTLLFENFRGDFGIPVFATQLDFALLLLLFVSLAVFAAVELQLSKRTLYLYEGALFIICIAYIFLRRSWDLEVYELRFSQLLAVMGFLSTLVYVIVHRRKYPHL